MAENTPMTEAQRQALIKEHIARQGKETLPPQTEASAVSFQKSQETKEVEARKVEPLTVTAVPANMAQFPACSFTLTYAQVADFVGYAHELYIPEVDLETGKKTVNLDQKWQRGLDMKRVNEAAKYLRQDTHFFPPIIVVPTNDSSVKIVVLDNGLLSVTLTGASAISALDGQHRVGAIKKVVDEKVGLDNEMLSISFLNITDFDLKRQVFADINRTPRRVSKSLNLVFDNSDRVARISKDIVHYEVATGDGKINHPYVNLIDLERPTPTGKSTYMMSLTNLYDMLTPVAKLTETVKVTDAEGKEISETRYVLDEQQLAEVFQAFESTYPEVNKLRHGGTNFDSVKREYVWASGTFWKAWGALLEKKMKAMNPDGKTRKIAPEDLGATIASWIGRINADGNWKLSAPIWQDPARRVVTDSKSIETKKGGVKNATDILDDLTA